jgi:hypothetical protein
MKKQQIQRIEQMYAMLLELYPTGFRQQFGTEMKFVFSESLRDAYEQDGSKGILILLGWTVIDLFTSLFNEHLAERKVYHSMNSMEDANMGPSAVAIQKSGGIASFLLAVAFVVSEFVYLTGNLREANGPLAYALADFLYGPVRAACLIAAVYALRERIGERAPRQMSLAMLTAVLSAAMFVTAALFRSTNRHYHMIHPELNLEASSTVLIVWTTLVGGVIATGWHFLGWSLVLLGSASWTSRRLPRILSVLYWVVGILSLFVYLLPDIEGGVVLLGVVMSIWQGILLWKAESRETPPPKTQINASRPELA